MWEIVETFIGALLWVLLVPLVGPFLLMFTLYRNIVVCLASVFRKDLSPLEAHYLAETREVKTPRNWNMFMVATLEFKGHLDVAELRKHVLKKVREDVDLRQLLGSDVVGWGGYLFAKHIPQSEIRYDLHVREISPDVSESNPVQALHEAILNSSLVNESGRPPWEILLWNQGSGKSVVVLKFLHVLSDAKSVMEITRRLFDAKRGAFKSSEKELEAAPFKVSHFLKSPYVFMKANAGALLNSALHPFGKGFNWKSSSKTTFVGKATFDFKKIMDIKRKLHVRTTPVLACLQAEALRQFCLSKGVSFNDTNYRISSLVPEYRNKSMLGNNWSELHVVVNLNEQDLVKRLLRTNQTFEEMERDGLIRINHFIFFGIFSSVPHIFFQLLHSSYDSIPHVGGLFPLIFSKDSFPNFKGLSLEEMSAFVPVKPEMSLRGLGWATVTVGSKVEVSYAATKDLFAAEQDVDLYRSALQQTLEKYHTLSQAF